MSLSFLDIAVKSSAILHQRKVTLNRSRSVMWQPWNIQSLIQFFVRGLRWISMKTLNHIFGFLYYTGKRFYSDKCFLLASSLTYTVLLSIVPLMTIVFAIFSAFPNFSEILLQQLQIIVITNMVPEVGEKVQEYLNNFMANALQVTTIGVPALLFSAFLLFLTIESAFQSIWRISEPRTLLFRFSAFWTILTLCPLLFGASLSLSDIIISYFDRAHFRVIVGPFEDIIVVFPLIVEFVIFTMLYILIPNRPMSWDHWVDVVVGGVAATVVFEFLQDIFAWYVQTFPTYETIYGAISTIPIFLLWLYLAWCAILFGAVVAASRSEWRSGSLTDLQAAPRMALALAVLGELLEASRNGAGLTRRTLIERLRVGSVLVDGILEQLRYTAWVARTNRDTWVLTRDLSLANLYDLENALGLGIRGTIRDFSGLDERFKEHFSQVIEQIQSRYRDVMDINIKELFTEIK